MEENGLKCENVHHDSVDQFSESTRTHAHGKDLKLNIRQIPPQVLAYLGDAVFEVFARMHSLQTARWNVNQLHKTSVNMVKAESQADILSRMHPFLTDDEKDIVRRGRNAKSGQTPKGVSVVLYRYSTAFETLIGYLHLTDNQERMEELFNSIDLFSSELK